MRFEYADSRMPSTMTKDGNIYYLTCDQVGSLRIVADSSGNVVKKISYDSFGNIINDSNPAFDIPFGFAGGLFDTDTGLIRFGVRDYDPDIGRWTAKDPIFFAGGDTDLYGYCLSDPVNGVDPEGLYCFSLATTVPTPYGPVAVKVTCCKDTACNSKSCRLEFGPGVAAGFGFDPFGKPWLPLGKKFDVGVTGEVGGNFTVYGGSFSTHVGMESHDYGLAPSFAGSYGAGFGTFAGYYVDIGW